MRIAIFVDELEATGVVVNAVALANRLHSEGHFVALIAARADGTLRSTVAAGIEVLGLVDDVQGEESRRSRLRKSIRAYRKALRAFRPEVLLSAGNQGHLASVFAVGAAPGCRLVVRVSNDIDHLRPGKSVKPLPRSWRSAKFALIAAMADRLVFVSQRLLGNAAVAAAHVAAKSVVIPNGVDRAEVAKRASEPCPHPWLNGDESGPVILAIGRLVQQKNLSTLLEAVAIARQAAPVRLLIIGSGPLEKNLAAEASALGLGDAFQILPPVANPMPYIARAAVFALPSWWEGSSNVLLEALACGTPVVASRIAGSAEEILGDGRYGRLVDPDDAGSMASALLAQQGKFAVRPGERAADYSRDAQLRAYSRLLTTLDRDLPAAEPRLELRPLLAQNRVKHGVAHVAGPRDAVGAEDALAHRA